MVEQGTQQQVQIARVVRPHEQPLVLHGRSRLHRMDGQTNGRMWEVPLIRMKVYAEVYVAACRVCHFSVG